MRVESESVGALGVSVRLNAVKKFMMAALFLNDGALLEESEEQMQR